MQAKKLSGLIKMKNGIIFFNWHLNCSRQNSVLKYFAFTILFFFGCAEKNSKPGNLISTTPKTRLAKGYLIPKDSLALPEIKIIPPPKIVRAGVPKTVTINPEFIEIKNPEAVLAPSPVICKPGYNSFTAAKIQQAKPEITVALLPEVIPAKIPSSKEINPENITTFGLEQGLKNLNIHDVKTDKFGNMWMASGFGGICKYDGKNFSHYTELQGLLSNNTNTIYIDSEENLWFGTYSGAVKYDGTHFTNYTVKSGLAGNNAFGIAEDKKGNMWFGTFNGLSMLDKKKQTFTTFTTENGLPDNGIWAIKPDRYGNIWVATIKGGLSVITISDSTNVTAYTFNNYSRQEGLPANYVTGFFEDASFNMWASTLNGVCKMETVNEKTKPIVHITNYTKKNGFINSPANCITGDADGNIWIGTETGITIMENNKGTGIFRVKYLQEKDGLPSRNILSIFNDRYNNVWIGAELAGISKYSGNTFTSYQKTDGLSSNTIAAVIEDRNGAIWLGTFDKGLIKYQPFANGKPAQFSYYTTKEGLNSDLIRSLFLDHDGNIWIGSLSDGITKFTQDDNGGTFNYYTIEKGPPGMFVSSIMEDKQGNLWFARLGSLNLNNGGVFKLVKDSLTIFRKAQGLPDNDTWSVAQDKFGNFWFGSWGKGLTKYIPGGIAEKGTVIQYNQTNGLLDDKVRPILADSKGNVWVGGKQGLGLTKFTSSPSGLADSITYLTTADGLSNNSVASILEDKENQLWFGNYYGLSKLSVNNKNAGQVSFTNFTAENGFQGKSATTNGILQSKDGLIWLATYNRLLSFLPQKITADTSMVNLQLTDVYLFNEKIFWKKDSSYNLKNGAQVAGFKYDSLSKWFNIPQNLSLAYFTNAVNFQFAGIYTNKLGGITYQWMLQGLEKDWNLPTYQSEIYYNNLSPGNYTFLLRAKNGEGGWTVPLAYNFKIRTPWWYSWWAFLIYALLAAGIIYFFIYYRVRQGVLKIKELEKIRTKISSDLHDDVGTILSGLAMQSQILAISAKDKTKEQLNEISSMSRDAMEHMRDTVWAMDSRKDKFENLIDRMRAFAEKNLAMKNITHEFILNQIDTKKFIDPEKRQNIYLVFKEAITNIIKHSDGRHVTIQFTENKNSLLLLVHDNGNEKTTASSDGLGLSNMKMRAAKIGGTLKAGYNNGYQIILTIN